MGFIAIVQTKWDRQSWWEQQTSGAVVNIAHRERKRETDEVEDFRQVNGCCSDSVNICEWRRESHLFSAKAELGAWRIMDDVMKKWKKNREKRWLCFWCSSNDDLEIYFSLEQHGFSLFSLPPAVVVVVPCLLLSFFSSHVFFARTATANAIYLSAT